MKEIDISDPFFSLFPIPQNLSTNTFFLPIDTCETIRGLPLRLTSSFSSTLHPLAISSYTLSLRTYRDSNLYKQIYCI